MKPLADLREDYTQAALELGQVASDPFTQFERWFEEARHAEVPEPNAMTLSTVGAEGQPYSRVVLLKGLENGRFVFYTNYHSRKGLQLAANPKVALNFLWLRQERQITIIGTAEKVDEAVSDSYFQSRPRGSQEGAWVSPQSEPIENREVLEKRAQIIQAQYADQPVPRPPHWGGYAVVPSQVEFWQGRTSRLHDRIVYTFASENEHWSTQRLAP